MEPVYLAWYDGDRKKPARAKLADAIDRYREKWGREPRFCLTSPQDAEELAKEQATLFDVEVHGRRYIPRWTFYVGESRGEVG